MVNKKIRYLLRRDLALLIHRWKRMLLFACSILFIDFILVIYSQAFVFKQEIFGVTVNQFIETPERFPLQWIWQQIGIILICIDFVKKDFGECFSYLLSRIRKKSYFWASKMITVVLLAFVLSCYMLIEKYGIILLFNRYGVNIGISGMVLLRTVLFGFVGMCTLCWIYSLISMACNEIMGVIGCLAYIICGIPTKVQWLYCNCFMSIRGEFEQVIVAGGIILAFCFSLGIMKINKTDVIGRR